MRKTEALFQRTARALDAAMNMGRALEGELERALVPLDGGEEAADELWEAMVEMLPEERTLEPDLAETVTDAVRSGIREAALQVDTEALSRALLEPISRGLARQAYARRYGP